MIKEICLDTGVITLFLMENAPEKINILFNEILSEKIIAYTLAPVLAEVFKHLCVAKGKLYSQISVSSILDKYPVQLVDINKSLILKAGELKCQYRNELSYVDFFLLAYGLLNKIEIHSTEKDFPMIPNLKIIRYKF